MHGDQLGVTLCNTCHVPTEGPGIGTQHLKIPKSIPVDAQDDTRGVWNRESTGIGHT